MYPCCWVYIWGNEFLAVSLLGLKWQFQALQWRHNGRDSVSNHQPHHCLLNRLFMRRSKKTSKLRVIGLCVGNSPVTGEFPTQMASNAENVSIWWRHHEWRDVSNCPMHKQLIMEIRVAFCDMTLTHDDVIEWKPSAIQALCAENSPLTGEFPTQRPVTRSFHVFFDLRLHERLSKKS